MLHSIEFVILKQQFREESSEIAHKQYHQQLQKLIHVKTNKPNFLVSNNALSNDTYDFYSRIKKWQILVLMIMN